MSNLHDKRFASNRPQEQPEQWEFCCIPKQFKTGRLRYSIDGRNYYVKMTSVHPQSDGTSRLARYETRTFRADDPESLRKKILREYTDAVFSRVSQEPELDLKAEHAQQMRDEKAKQSALAEKQEFENAVVAEHRKLASRLTKSDRINAACSNLSFFASDPNFSSPEWVRWFAQFQGGFFSYPNGEWLNRDCVLRYCESKGQTVPLAGEIAEALQYLLAHKHLYLKPTYKRSEIDDFNAVAPFVREIKPVEQISQDQIREAVRRLSAKFGMPLQVSVERLQAVGIPNAETMFEKLQSLYSAEPIAEQSTADLKAGLQSMRNDARGGARCRQDNLKGY